MHTVLPSFDVVADEQREINRNYNSIALNLFLLSHFICVRLPPSIADGAIYTRLLLPQSASEWKKNLLSSTVIQRGRIFVDNLVQCTISDMAFPFYALDDVDDRRTSDKIVTLVASRFDYATMEGAIYFYGNASILELELQEVFGFIPASLEKLQITKFKVHSRASVSLITNPFSHFTFAQLWNWHQPIQPLPPTCGNEK